MAPTRACPDRRGRCRRWSNQLDMFRIVYSVYMPRRIWIALVVAALFNIAAFAQKPNVTGTWKLILAKSDFGPLPAPTSRTDVIEHNDPNLKDSSNADTAQGKQEY